ncbi:hypothetical protein GCM10022295_90570 [Streptomyces osmaniensis]|uniref:Uncharacterized protein n=2 Tax=Streptomyces osmaniensis TaxID=593134 RepID=A0ABP6Z0M4_9ACTN
MDRIRAILDLAGQDILGEMDNITDPVARQEAAREVNETLLPALVAEVKAHRAETVAGLREGRTLAQVGELLGGTSIARVDQILKGR